MTNFNITQDNIVYEDDILIVVYKPAGLATQSSENKKNQNLYEMLQVFLNEREKKNIYLALHHRLDAATAGLVLFCKNQSFNKYITDLFRDKTISKNYLAKVNILNPSEFKFEIGQTWQVKNFLKSFKIKHYKLSKSANKGDEAITDFKLLATDKKTTATIHCSPQTGRLHQIRVHLADLGLPIIGDFHYNKKNRHKSLFLVAYKMSFIHPKTKKLLEVEIDGEKIFTEFEAI